jgi:general secretion pathway protein H
MRTSAAGSLKRRLVRRTARAGGQRGFTLIELMVVVLIVALASGMVVFSLRDTQGIALEREGQRLAALLEYARAQSRLQGTPVRWRVTRNGFALEGLNKPVPEQPWLSPDTRVLDVLPRNPAIDSASLAVLALGPEPVLAPQSVLLGSGQTPGNTVRVASDGVQPFAIVPADLAVPANTGRAP